MVSGQLLLRRLFSEYITMHHPRRRQWKDIPQPQAVYVVSEGYESPWLILGIRV